MRDVQIYIDDTLLGCAISRADLSLSATSMELMVRQTAAQARATRRFIDRMAERRTRQISWTNPAALDGAALARSLRW